MSKKMKKAGMSHDGVALKGFFRVQIVDDKGVAGDTGWMENQVVNNGIRDYLVKHLLGSTSDSRVSYVALGTGSAPASDATALPGELGEAIRATVSTSVVSSRTAQFTAAFASADSFVTANRNISNVALFNGSSTAAAGDVLFAGNTYTSSTVATNQAVNVNFLRQLLATVISKFRKFGGSLKGIFETIPSRAFAY